MFKVAIIEDDPDLLHLLSRYLERNGFATHKFGDGKDFFSFLLKEESVDIVLLDIMLPYVDGMEILRMLKSNEKTRGVPVIVITAKGEESDIVMGLEVGADDYVVKPFSFKELVARMKAVLRRKDVGVQSGIRLDFEGCRVFVGGRDVGLTFSEYTIFRFLFENKGKAFTRSKLLDLVWGEDKAVTERSIDVHIVSIRKKLGEYGKQIKTVRGIGYRFED